MLSQSQIAVLLFLQKSYNGLQKMKNLITKDSIMITTLDSDTLYGRGFESNSDLENWRIINPSGVSGSTYR